MRICTVLAVLAALATLQGCITSAPKSRVASTQALRTRLPLRSEARLDRTEAGWIVVRTALSIRQVGDSAQIQVKEGRQSNSEGAISIAEFRAFWDSLGQLGFWHLKDAYEAPSHGEGGIRGQMSVSCEYQDPDTTAKTVRFSNPEACSLEFRRVYQLFQNMARFAKPGPDSLKDTQAPSDHR